MNNEDIYYSYTYFTYHHPDFKQCDQIYDLTKEEPVVFSSRDKVSKVVEIRFCTDTMLSEKTVKKINKIFNCKAVIKVEYFD